MTWPLMTHSGHAALWSAFCILRISQRLAALIIRLFLLSQNSGQALLRNPKIGTEVERSAEIIQSQIRLTEQFIRLSALRKRNGVLRLGSQCFAKIIDRLLVVAQGEVQTGAIEIGNRALGDCALFQQNNPRWHRHSEQVPNWPSLGCNRHRQSRAST